MEAAPRLNHAIRTCPVRRLGCQYISSTSTSVHGQNEATALNGAFDWRNARRHFSFNVQVLQMRHPTAKLSSVRGSTIAPRSIPARLARDTNSSALDWQVGDTLMLPTPVGTTLPPPTSLFCSSPNQGQAHSQCLFTETGRLCTGFDKAAAGHGAILRPDT